MERHKEGVLRSRGRLFLLIMLAAMILPLVAGNAFAGTIQLPKKYHLF